MKNQPHFANVPVIWGFFILMSKPSLREISKHEFDSNNTIEHINGGSLQRIADACEKMAVNFEQMHFQLTKAKNELEAYRKRWNDALKTNQYLRAANTKLKNKLKAVEQKEQRNA
jgi:vacuolar-type H+-ATPase subunit H